MIFVSLGTHSQPMARLVPALESLARELSAHGPFVIQHGATSLPSGWAGARLLPRERLLAYLAEADVVITHGGPATVEESLHAGKVPIVIPRRKSLREHVDDHQVTYALALAAGGKAVLADELGDLLGVVRAYLAAPPAPPPAIDTGPAVKEFADLASRVLLRGRRRGRSRR